MPEMIAKVDLVVPDADSEETETLTQDLRDELLQLNLDSVDMARAGEPPVDAKVGTDLIVAGTLLLTASGSSALPAVIEVIKSWVNRSAARKARLEVDGDVLDVQGLSSSEQQILIQEWLVRHRSGS